MSDFPERCPTCGAVYQYFDGGDGVEKQCACSPPCDHAEYETHIEYNQEDGTERIVHSCRNCFHKWYEGEVQP